MKTIAFITIFLSFLGLFTLFSNQFYKPSIESDIKTKVINVIQSMADNPQAIENVDIKVSGQTVHINNLQVSADKKELLFRELRTISGAYFPDLNAVKPTNNQKIITKQNGRPPSAQTISLSVEDNLKSPIKKQSSQRQLFLKVERLSNHNLIITGNLSEEMKLEGIHNQITQAHTETIGENDVASISNNLLYIVDATTPWWSDHYKTFVYQFLKQTKGIAKIEYTPSGVYIEGSYPNAEDYYTAKQTFSDIPDQVDIFDEFMTVEGDDQSYQHERQLVHLPKRKNNSRIHFRNKFEKKLQQYPILFKSGSTWMGDGEIAKIAQLAALIKRQKFIKSPIIVGAYTDNKGDQEMNESMSLDRANLVKEKLVSLGIPSDRLTVKYFDPNKTIVPRENNKRQILLSLKPQAF